MLGRRVVWKRTQSASTLMEALAGATDGAAGAAALREHPVPEYERQAAALRQRVAEIERLALEGGRQPTSFVNLGGEHSVKAHVIKHIWNKVVEVGTVHSFEMPATATRRRSLAILAAVSEPSPQRPSSCKKVCDSQGNARN